VFVNGGDKADSTLNLTFGYRDKTLNVAGKMGSISHALSVGEVPANLNITSGRSNMVYAGNAGYKDDKLVINGSLKLATDDIVSWIGTASGSEEDKPIPGVTYKQLPLQAKGEITSENGKIIFPSISMEGAIIKGTARVEISPPYGIDVKGDIASLDLETLFSSKLFALKQSEDPLKEVQKNKEASFIIAPKSFLNSLNLSTELKVDDIIYNQQHIKTAHAEFDMSGGEMTISQVNAVLPGETHVVFTGIGKEGFDGFALEGQVDASGADFSEAIKILKANGAALPTDDFKRFRLKANSIFSAKEVRMSEITARIENIALVGGFIATFGDQIKLNAAMRVGGLNIDSFVKVWGLDQWHQSFFDTTPGAKYDSFLARWLKRLDYNASVNLALEQYVLAGLPREKAELKLEASSGKVMLNDLKTTFNGSHITGSIGIDVVGNLPHLDLKLTTDVFDADTFFTKDGKLPPELQAAQAAQAVAAPAALPGQPAAATAAAKPGTLPATKPVAPAPATAVAQPASPTTTVAATPAKVPGAAGAAATPPAPGTPATPGVMSAATPPVDLSTLIPHWSHSQFDFHWMEMFTAQFHFKVGNYKQGRIAAQSLDVLGSVDNRTFTIEALTGYMLGAQVAAKVNIVAGKIPSVSLAANITSLDPVQVVPFIPLLQGMSGRYNLSLRLDSSGIDMYSWISSLQGTVGLGGDNVNIHGFNLPGVIRAVSYVRTVADILNVVKRAFPGGDTMFTNIEGQWSVAGGVLKTSNTRMTNSEANGVLSCQVDLVNWQIQSNISLALKILDPAKPPGMVITFNGSLINPETALDTRSLERYVTNKTSQDMLQEYGTR
jgi:hypothetical protein